MLAGDVLDRWIVGLVEGQRFARIGDNPACDRYDAPAGGRLDRDRMSRARDLDRLRRCLDGLFHGGVTFGCRVAGDYVADLPPSTKST